jgi:hypothetical protein
MPYHTSSGCCCTGVVEHAAAGYPDGACGNRDLGCCGGRRGQSSRAY